MKNILDGIGMLLQGLAVIISLMAGAIILIIASILGKIHDPQI